MLKLLIDKIKSLIKQPEKEEIKVFFFLPINGTYEDEVIRDIELVCNKINIRPEYTDKDGYDVTINSATFDGKNILTLKLPDLD